jgi:O-antigen/teichoic acid export membrane protein
MTGTTLAQVLPIAASPLLSRLYSPEDFGVLGLYAAICAVVSVLAAGRYEIAIVQPRDDGEAANLAALSVCIALAVSAAMWLAVLAFHDPIVAASQSPELGRWLWLLPASVLIATLYQILNFWNNRRKHFRRLAISRAVQSAATVGTQCTLGYPQGAAGGLITGYVAGQALGLLWLAHSDRACMRQAVRQVSLDAMKRMGARYRKLPLFSSWGALLDTAALQMPLLVIAHVFGFAVTGLFSFTFRVLTVPLNLIAGSIAQVLFQRVAELHNNDPASLRRYLLRIFAVLACLSIPPVLVFAFFGVEIFSFVFGASWAHAGSYSGILIVAAAARFCVSPLSVVLSLEQHIKKGVAWQLGYFLTLSGVLFSFSDSSVEIFLRAFAIHEVVQYGIYLAIILRAAASSETISRAGTQPDCDPLPTIRKQ